jgi:transcriptional regulator with XRE-family HTH domain
VSKRSDQGGWPSSGFGLRLRILRDRAGLSQTALAERAGCTQSTLAKLEAGKQEPAWPLVTALAVALEATPNDFLPRPGDREPEPPRRGRPPKVDAPAPQGKKRGRRPKGK